VYLGLLAAWLFVLDSKIRHGPEPVGAKAADAGGGLMSAVSGLVAHTDSLIDTREGD